MKINVEIKKEDINKKEIRKALIDIESIPGIKMISGLITDNKCIFDYRKEIK